ncbi:histidine kinase [Ancylothrix sp. C2]|uniref:histidine kinase n=1 Tax=Ancylothrix sp. D3o TaxID=2953691 RepID=UPI0021BB70F8|nr:histidine kinase [Ancylothrix sp. D3o]MCT7948525.1 histidine kinase [Ancylothrix sp. D3o]
MAIPCHILVVGNPAVIYASRNGSPEKVRRILKPFLEKFLQERETAGEYCDTPECLVAQIVVRFGFEICEDDFSNLRVGVAFNSDVQYLYSVAPDWTVTVWVPTEEYRQNPSLGLKACQQLENEGWTME